MLPGTGTLAADVLGVWFISEGSCEVRWMGSEFHDVPGMPDWIWIRRVWKEGQYLGFSVVFVQPFLNGIHGMEGHIIPDGRKWRNREWV